MLLTVPAAETVVLPAQAGVIPRIFVVTWRRKRAPRSGGGDPGQITDLGDVT